MSITDELRDWFKDRMFMANGWQEIHDIADHIDAEHERCMADATLDAAPTEAQLSELGYIELPKDADGEAWHIGDRTESGQTIEAMGLNRHGWHFVGTVNEIDPAIHRHYHAPTVEDVLREFALKVAGEECMTIRTGVVEEYAAKLRLAEGEDA